MNIDLSAYVPGHFLYLVGPCLVIFLVIWRLWCGIVVFYYAAKYNDKIESKLVLFSRPVWVCIGIFTGILGVALFWACHHSTLNPLVMKKIREAGEAHS